MNDVLYPYLLSLGANLGDRQRQLRDAVAALGHLPTTEVLAVSDIYETDPVELLAQPPFLNLAVHLVSGYDPHAMLGEILRIEADLGRQRAVRYGPRTIDIDILLSDDRVIVDDPQLIIPHPRMHQRAFVLVPLVQIASTALHPTWRRSIAELQELVDGKEGVRWYSTFLRNACGPTES
ncbi:MAG: 2-amino-4-hydroxy-6-hydroxymethyldihydropteridine diphosphokinase [Firmicutes bacterium]|nr:2-amino-4-hydroxy-6-hydroxymethyldihydropteridine diphosphokinase [Bacillota bacterium]